jgi:hypothetical protein
MIDTVQVNQWFRMLYGQARGYLHIASTGDWAGRAFDLADGFGPAIGYVGQLDALGRAGIYSRVTTLTKPPKRGHRGGADLTASLPALWADVDIAGPGHKHTACPGGSECTHSSPHAFGRILPLPPDADSAIALVEDSPLPLPSLWVHSGGGLYPIWLLDPTHHVDGDLVALRGLSAGWQWMIATSAQEHGWHYGSGVGDMARVLRVAGTENRKPALPEPAPCYVAGGTMVRYTIGDLHDALAQARQKVSTRASWKYRPVARRPVTERPTGDVRPGDDFTARVDWSDDLLLGRLRWKCTAQSGKYREWLRPGAAGTLTATTGKGAGDNLWVFSTEAPPFPAERPISKLEAFRLLGGHETYRDAVRALNGLGFGSAAFAPRGADAPSMPPLDWPEGMLSTKPNRHGGE